MVFSGILSEEDFMILLELSKKKKNKLVQYLVYELLFKGHPDCGKCCIICIA